MKRFLTIILAGAVLLTTACESTNTVAPEEKNEVVSTSTVSVEEKTEVSTENTETEEAFADIEAIGDIEVDKNLFTVELTIPAEYVGEATQEELDEEASEKGYKSVTLNEDGSATYVMTKAQHKEMLDAIRTNIDESLVELINNEDYTFTKIEANENYTDFKVNIAGESLNLSESFAVLGLYMYGGLYGIFSGERAENVHVTFISDVTGEVVSEADSNKAGN